MTGDGFDVEVQARRVMAQGTECDLGAAWGSFFTLELPGFGGAYPKPLHVTDLGNYWQLLHTRFPYFENNEKIVPSLLRSVFIFHV